MPPPFKLRGRVRWGSNDQSWAGTHSAGEVGEVLTDGEHEATAEIDVKRGVDPQLRGAGT